MGCSCSYHSILEEFPKNECTRYKVLITGLRKVGKTSLLNTTPWDIPEKMSTQSCLTTTKKTVINGNPVYIDIWDTTLLKSSYFMDMSVAVLVIDLENNSSLNIDITKVKSFSRNIIIAGNKFDNSEAEVLKEAKDLAQTLQCYFVPVSTLTGFGIKDLWDLVLYLISY